VEKSVDGVGGRVYKPRHFGRDGEAVARKRAGSSVDARSRGSQRRKVVDFALTGIKSARRFSGSRFERKKS
jgi:hypothetical protein